MGRGGRRYLLERAHAAAIREADGRQDRRRTITQTAGAARRQPPCPPPRTHAGATYLRYAYGCSMSSVGGWSDNETIMHIVYAHAIYCMWPARALGRPAAGETKPRFTRGVVGFGDVHISTTLRLISEDKLFRNFEHKNCQHFCEPSSIAKTFPRAPSARQDL